MKKQNEKFLVCGGRAKIQGGLGMSDTQFVFMVAQLSHFGWSALVLTWIAILIPQYFYWGYAIWVLITAAKEFWFDFNVFTWQPGFEDNVQSGGPWGDVFDFTFYLIGGAAAWLALRAKGMI